MSGTDRDGRRASSRIPGCLALAVVMGLAVPASAAAQAADWTTYESQTVNISKRQTYFVDLDFSMAVPPEWTVVEDETVPARPEAQHGRMVVREVAPLADGAAGPASQVIVRILALPLDAAITKSWLSYADQDLAGILGDSEQVSRSTRQSALAVTPYIISKPGYAGYVSTDLVETVYKAVDAEGHKVKSKAYTLWCLNIVANVVYVAAPDRFDEGAEDFERVAASFWVQVAHPY